MRASIELVALAILLLVGEIVGDGSGEVTASRMKMVICFNSNGERLSDATDFMSCALMGGKLYLELSPHENGGFNTDKECKVVPIANGEGFEQKCVTDEEREEDARFICEFYKGEETKINGKRECVPITFIQGEKESLCYDESSELVDVNLDFTGCAESGGRFWYLQQVDPATGEWYINGECTIGRDDDTGLPVCHSSSSAAAAEIIIETSGTGGITRATQVAVSPSRPTCVGRNRRWTRTKGGKLRCVAWPARKKGAPKKKSSKFYFPTE